MSLYGVTWLPDEVRSVDMVARRGWFSSSGPMILSSAGREEAQCYYILNNLWGQIKYQQMLIFQFIIPSYPLDYAWLTFLLYTPYIPPITAIYHEIHGNRDKKGGHNEIHELRDKKEDIIKVMKI